MVEERVTTDHDLDFIVEHGTRDGFDFHPTEIKQMLELGKEISTRLTSYFYHGKLLAVSGLITSGLISDEAHIWMISTKEVDEHKLPFIRHAKKILTRLPFNKVTCYCDKTLTKTDRWLSGEGFTYIKNVEIMGRQFNLLERVL